MSLCKKCFISMLLLFLPITVFASPNENSNGSQNGVTVSSESSSSASSSGQAQNEVRTQTNNPGTGTMTQTEAEVQLQDRIQESKPEYSPKNEMARTRQSEVATAAEYLVRVAERVENQGIGDQIRTIAQTQSKNQDKINASVDKAETRTGFAKFFIGANMKELANAKQTMEQNREQIRELQQLMLQLDNDADKLEVANQIITLQENQIALREQLADLGSGFSLFGWIARWRWNFWI